MDGSQEPLGRGSGWSLLISVTWVLVRLALIVALGATSSTFVYEGF